jgi:hypothetical protein
MNHRSEEQEWDRVAFAGALRDLVDAVNSRWPGRVTLSTIAMQGGGSRQTVNGWLTGRSMPSDEDALCAFVDAVARLAGSSAQFDTNKDAWRERFRAIKRAEARLRQQRRRAGSAANYLADRPTDASEHLQAYLDALSAPASASTTPSGPVEPGILVVQNKIAAGPAELIEDATPAYLSTKKIPYGARHGCKVPGSEMWSGEVLRATHQSKGARMTNYNLDSLVVQRNPHRWAPEISYLAERSDGKVGYLSEVYVAEEYRGGMGLPYC